MGLTLFVALISIPGITVGLYARARLITFIKLAVGVGTVRNHHAQPHRHHALPIQAPAAEAEGGDRHHEKPPPPYLGRKSGG
jgi:hypothetical protein